MSLANQKFILTANRKQVRLFPQNYGILSREHGGKDWQFIIDVAVPEALATSIFQKVHTSHDIKWGEAGVALHALNQLLGVVEEAPVESETDWVLEGIIEGYYLWVRRCAGKELFQCTPSESPPINGAGYGSRRTLLKLKNLVPRAQGPCPAPGCEEVG